MRAALVRRALRWLSLWLCLSFSLALTTPRAFAQEPGGGASANADVERAKESFRIGAAAYAAGE
ncbi:MAG TPA: hypothetical protein VMG12_06285, partial [Polyangiaceae bacterium]|nr:hypothetical protein [Polyangiaceae bacterium]